MFFLNIYLRNGRRVILILENSGRFKILQTLNFDQQIKT